MPVARALLVVFCVLAAGLARASEPAALPEEIRVASEEWNSYTQADGQGLAWDILREVFQTQGVKLDMRSVPYTRSVGLVQRREVDALVGSYQDETDGALYPRWNYDTDHIYSLGLATSPPLSLDTLGNHRLVWVRGYRYQDYLPNIQRFNEIRRRVGILPMLQQGRADFYIDALTEVEFVLAQAEDRTQFRRTHLAELPLFLAFANNERGRVLCALFDRRMDELVKDGRLRPIFQRWQQPYPFDAKRPPADR
ncbi:ABC transporter substrate-binding protein [Pseudomonas sp. NFIX28]|jgi:ABC-type amino acid transport substrate-binding protein|uniref:substrate-binding periplasmic protein n=1 Tax=Pseudomonas sp. NFIX28 TaxID=1566235 RepID=UPI000895FFA9|nr:transporter substrate-binding domain-containing protein [Pseudomonas sp. NFIX28]SDZ64651.1 ABC-type amino acid transport substrate-binding protein [Pseudomonas sp. NFIX28]